MWPISGSLIANRYELVEHIHTSDMSKVYKAWDFQQQNFVVVKIATNNSKNFNLVESLKREALALGRLNHPRIVRLLDCGDVGESYFVVLEYVYGTDLDSCFCKIWPFSLDNCISVMMDVLDGLEAMHKEGLVHRDIKPGNLMVTEDGIKIIDLGLVRFRSVADRQMKSLTGPGIALGTPPYLSPEQWLGLQDLDCRSDLYVCGIVLYELLTAELPFYEFEKEGKLLEDFWKKPLRPFCTTLSPIKIPRKVQAIAWKAMEINPAKRYQTAGQMRMALQKELDSYSKIILP